MSFKGRARAVEQGVPVQRHLSKDRIAAFWHEDFVEDQAHHFLELVGEIARPAGVVVDVGGGCGFFAKRLRDLTGRRVRVLDSDAASIRECEQLGIDAEQADALAPTVAGDEDVVTFNLILHHLVGSSERETRELQSKALALWRRQALAVFVNEYVYESYFGNWSGRLIYWITRSPLLSRAGKIVSRFVPSLRANTFGIGVRFRAHAEWERLFAASGYRVASSLLGDEEPVSFQRRLLLIRSCRRDSFLLLPLK